MAEKDKEIAKTILQQLGGNRFIAMTGAKNFTVGDNELIFRIPKSKKKINLVKIKLTSEDLYDMEFGKIEKFEYKVVDKTPHLFFDQLQDVFTERTGLNTSLGKLKKVI